MLIGQIAAGLFKVELQMLMGGYNVGARTKPRHSANAMLEAIISDFELLSLNPCGCSRVLLIINVKAGDFIRTKPQNIFALPAYLKRVEDGAYPETQVDLMGSPCSFCRQTGLDLSKRKSKGR